MKSAKHQKNKLASASTSSIKHFLPLAVTTERDNLQLKVTNAEAVMAQLIAKYNLPPSSADRFTKAFKVMFSDSDIANKYQCSRNKTMCFVKELDIAAQADLVARMKAGPFTLSTDGSNDEKAKQFPLVVQSINPNRQVTSELLSVPVCHGSATGENIFTLIQLEIESRQVSWRNCLSFGSDNANVMVRLKKGVFAFLKEKNPDIFLSGCTLHLVHIGSEKAADSLPVAF